MKNTDTRYWMELAGVTALLIILGLVGFIAVFPGNYPPALPIVLAIMVIMAVASHIKLSSLLDQKFSKYNTAFLIYKGLKFLVIMTLLIVYSLLDKDHSVPIIMSTLIMYLAYMIFEARSLNRQSRKQAKQ
jgi:hypothetical protein